MKRQQGYSLVSTMVGLIIGLVVSATAVGTVSFIEAQKRTSMGSNSALVNGGLGLFRIESEAKLAGLGLMAKQTFACQSFNLSYKGEVRLDGTPLYPAMITDGGTNADTLAIAYLNTLTGAAYSQVLLPMEAADSPIKLSNAPDAIVGSLLLLQDVIPSNPCTLRQVTARGVTAFGTDITHGSGDYNGGVFTNPVAYTENSRASASRGFVWSTFRVRNNTLEEVNNVTGQVAVIADGIIGMKVQYGVTDGVNPTVSEWTSATDTYAAPTVADMLKVRALRVGVAARSLERDSSCSTTTSTLTYWAGGPTVDVSGITDWRCYKYRTFNMVVPLINVVMGTR